MNAAERFVTICGEIGNYTEKMTGVSVVDAYTGPDEFNPKKQSKEKTPTDLVHDIHLTFDKLRDEIEDPIRLEYMMGELHSMNIVVDWVAKHFSKRWAIECEMCFNQIPPTCYIALEDNQMIGFACY